MSSWRQEQREARDREGFKRFLIVSAALTAAAEQLERIGEPERLRVPQPSEYSTDIQPALQRWARLTAELVARIDRDLEAHAARTP